MSGSTFPEAPPEEPPARAEKGRFKKAARVTGRKPGTPNRTTTVLKEAILLAASDYGEDGKGKNELPGFLRKVIEEDLRTFCGLLGRVLPYTIEAKREQAVEVVYRSVEEVRREILSRGIDVEVITRILSAPPAIEHKSNGHDDMIEVEHDGR